jgi:undecaprenyl-diphosphatase
VIQLLQSLDLALFLKINSWHADFLNPVMVFLSGQVLWLPLIGFMLFLAKKNLSNRSFGIFVLFLILSIIATDVTSSYIFKNIFQRLRPCRVAEIASLIHQFGQKCGGRFGFVSSHAGNSIAIISFAVFSLGLKEKKYWPLWILPILVSYSRIYLGVHYPGDILGGFIIGLMWGTIFSRIFSLNTYGASLKTSQP